MATWLRDSFFISQADHDTRERQYFPLVIDWRDVMYDPFGPVYQYIGRTWFVSMEEAEFWWNLMIAPSPGQDSALEEGLTI